MASRNRLFSALSRLISSASAEIDSGDRDGVTTAEAEEIKRLKAENKRLREANEILRRASIFFAGELDPRNR